MNFIANNWWAWGLLTLLMASGWAWNKRPRPPEVEAQFVVVTTGFIGCITVCYMIATIVGVILTAISLLMKFFGS